MCIRDRVITALIYFVVPHKGRHHLEHATTVQSVRRPGIFSALRIVYSNPQSWLVGISGTALYMPLSILGALWGVEYISSVTGGNKVAAAGAVSMLDVYKRQLPRGLKNSPFTAIVASSPLERRFNLTVSYTHLDVYKRQILGAPERAYR